MATFSFTPAITRLRETLLMHARPNTGSSNQAGSGKEIKGMKSKIHTVGWNCDGSRLAAGSVDNTTRVWSLSSLSSSTSATKDSSATELKGHQGDVDQLVWDPTDPDRLATASVDKSVRLWDMRGNTDIHWILDYLAPTKPRHIIQTTGENINIAWSPDGKNIAVGNKDDTISFIDPRGGSNSSATGGSNSTGTKKYIWHTINHDIEINEIRWNYPGDLFFLTTGQGTVKILEFPSFKHFHIIHAHTANCYCIDFDPKGRYMATGSSDAIVSLWDLDELLCIRTFGSLDWPVRTISFSHDGDLIASGSEDHVVDISHIESGEHIYTIPCSAAVNTVAWHPSKYLLAYGGDGTRSTEETLRVFGL